MTRLSLRHWLLLTALFAVLGGGVFHNALSGPFHFDDRHGITENHYLRDPGNIPKFYAFPAGKNMFAPSEPRARHYRPLLLTSYTLNYYLGGESAWGFHLYNLMLHIAGALLLVALAIRLGLAPPWAAGLGLVFLVHPIHTEAINYLTARSSLQSGVLSFAALYAFIRARECANRNAFFWLGLTGLFTIAAVLTKEVAVTIPLICLLYDLLYPPPRERRWGVHGFGLDLGLMAGGLGVLLANGYHRYFLEVLTGKVERARGVGENLWLQAQVLLEYIRLTLWPSGLSIIHDFTGADAPVPASIGAALVILAITGFAIRKARTLPGFAMGWGIFILILLPTTVLPMQVPLQESRGYAAVGGVMLALAVLGQWITARLRLNRRWSMLSIPLTIALVLALAVTTVQRNTVWLSDLALWRDAVTRSPENYRAHANLGSALHAMGRYQDAIGHYRTAIDLFANDAAVYADLGGALLHVGKLAEARQVLTQGLRIYEPYAHSHYNMGMVLEREGNIATAMRAYRRAIELVPNFTDARVNLGILMAKTGDLAGAAKQIETALDYTPGDGRVYFNLMAVYRAMGDTDRIHALFRRAQKNHAVTPYLEQAYAPFKQAG